MVAGIGPFIAFSFVACFCLTLAGCSRSARPTGEAQWIWPDGEGATPGRPAAWVLLRDFELHAPPPGPAVLFVAVDSEYAVHLNGRQIARGAWRRGQPTDEYLVDHLLHAGANRLAIEVRAPHGDGGALAGIEIADGSMPLITDGEWSAADFWQPLLIKGEAPLVDARPPVVPVRVWGSPPVGRWGRLGRGEPRATSRLWGVERPIRTTPVSTAPGVLAADGRQRSLRVEFGREVDGVLELEFDPGAAGGRQELRFCLAAKCERRPLVLTDGRPAWRDVVLRRFDTVVVIGLAELHAVRVRR